MALSRSLTKKFQKLAPKSNWSSKKSLSPAIAFSEGSEEFYSIRFEQTTPGVEGEYSTEELTPDHMNNNSLHSIQSKQQVSESPAEKMGSNANSNAASVLTVNVTNPSQEEFRAIRGGSGGGGTIKSGASSPDNISINSISHSPKQSVDSAAGGGGGSYTPPLSSAGGSLVLDEYFPPYQSMILAQQQLQEQKLQEQQQLQQAVAGQRLRSSTSSSVNQPCASNLSGTSSSMSSIPSTPIVTSSSGYSTPPLSISTVQSSNPASPVYQVYPTLPSKQPIPTSVVASVARPGTQLDSNAVTEAASVVLGHKAAASASSSNYSNYNETTPVDTAVNASSSAQKKAQEKALEEEAKADQMAMDILEKVRAEDHQVEEVQSEGAWCI